MYRAGRPIRSRTRHRRRLRGSPARHQAERQDAGGDAGAAGGHDRPFRRRRPAAANIACSVAGSASWSGRRSSRSGEGQVGGARHVAGSACPARGSGAVPAKRPRGAGIEDQRAAAALADDHHVADPAQPFRLEIGDEMSPARARRGAPVSTGRPSRSHFGRPPSSTAAASWPNSRIIHQPRADGGEAVLVVEHHPRWRWTTPSAPISLLEPRRGRDHVRQRRSPGRRPRRCRSSRAPGICAARNSRLPSWSSLGRYLVAVEDQEVGLAEFGGEPFGARPGRPCRSLPAEPR